MTKKQHSILIIICILVVSCTPDEAPTVDQTSFDCQENPFRADFGTTRTFKMGFSTWGYDATLEGRTETYRFIEEHADVYSEHIDNKIPWSAWINDTPLPSEFVNEIKGRVDNKLSSKKLVISVSLLNSARSELAEDFDGSTPAYNSLADDHIENAYFKHLDYILQQFNPDYFVLGIEVNELRINSPEKWEGYKQLARKIRSRLKTKYPDLKLSESITLHNWFRPDIENPNVFIEEISTYINDNLDFAAISFYPFFKGLRDQTQFQTAFDFLKSKTNKPIAFVETAHLAEDLIIEAFNTNIQADPCEQKAYLETLLNEAQNQNYEFVIWWAHRDFDALWETFPEEVKDLGRVWRDTGLLDELGNERPSFDVWSDIYDIAHP